jgi:hypothetical protein
MHTLGRDPDERHSVLLYPETEWGEMIWGNVIISDENDYRLIAVDDRRAE